MQTISNTYFPIQHLDKPRIEAPGLCYFLFAKHEDVQFWPSINPQSGTFTEAIILKEGTTWYRCQVLDQDRDLKEAQKESAAGIHFELSVNGFLPGDSLPNLLSLSAMPNHRYVIVLKERSGISRLLGHEDAGVRFTQNYDSSSGDGTRGYTLSFAFRSRSRPPVYLSAVAASGEIINPPWEGGGGGPETDPTVPVWVKQISQAQIANWDAAFGWGNHAAAGYLTQMVANGLYAPLNHNHTLASLSDVAFTGLQDGQFARYNGITGKWENFTPKRARVITINEEWAGRGFYRDPTLLGLSYLIFRGSSYLEPNLYEEHPDGGWVFTQEGDILELGQNFTILCQL